MDFLTATWSVTLELAPWLLLGTAVAGLLHVLVPTGIIERQLRGRLGVLKAALVGVPLPLCSCGVIPAGLGLKKDGASDGASIGFLISTPQTGVDSVLVAASFLGWPFALFKVVAALVTGLAGGLLTEAAGGTPRPLDPGLASGMEAGGRGLRGFLDHSLMLLRTIWRWLVFGVVVSAAITVFVPADAIAGMSLAGPLAMGVVLLISVPMYVCATASVPIAAALVGAELPAGAALVFLMAGPATNVATIGAIHRGFGGRVLGIYLTTIIVGSAGLGLVFDWVLPSAAAVHLGAHEHGAAWWSVASAGAFVALIAWFAMGDLRRWLRRRAAEGGAADLAFPVQGMMCNGCAGKVERALSAVEGVTSVVVTLETRTVQVQGRAELPRLQQAVRDAGFTPG